MYFIINISVIQAFTTDITGSFLKITTVKKKYFSVCV